MLKLQFYTEKAPKDIIIPIFKPPQVLAHLGWQNWLWCSWHKAKKISWSLYSSTTSDTLKATASNLSLTSHEHSPSLYMRKESTLLQLGPLRTQGCMDATAPDTSRERGWKDIWSTLPVPHRCPPLLSSKLSHNQSDFHVCLPGAENVLSPAENRMHTSNISRVHAPVSATLTII